MILCLEFQFTLRSVTVFVSWNILTQSCKKCCLRAATFTLLFDEMEWTRRVRLCCFTFPAASRHLGPHRSSEPVGVMCPPDGQEIHFRGLDQENTLCDFGAYEMARFSLQGGKHMHRDLLVHTGREDAWEPKSVRFAEKWKASNLDSRYMRVWRNLRKVKCTLYPTKSGRKRSSGTCFCFTYQVHLKAVVWENC